MHSNFPIDIVRKATLSCTNKLFFNSAGSSLISEKTKSIMSEYLDKESDIGGYDLMMKLDSEIQDFYIQAAKLINAVPKTISFQTSATDAYSKVLYAIDWQKGDRVLITEDDYVSNILSFLNVKKFFGIELEFIKNTEMGEIDFEDLDEKLAAGGVRLLAITHIPTSSGMVQDVERVGTFAQKYNVLYLLDACQSVGQMDVDVQKIKCDFLSVTGRKFLRGPRGSGFLYVSEKFINSDFAPLCFDLNGAIWETKDSFSFTPDAKRFELWEKNYSVLLGLTNAIREINEIGIQKIEKYNQHLNHYFRSKLASLKDVILFDQGSKQANIMTWKIKTLSLEKHQEMLNSCHVFYSVAQKRSALIDFEKKGIEWAIRFSPHYFNTTQECDQFIELFSKKYM